MKLLFLKSTVEKENILMHFWVSGPTLYSFVECALCILCKYCFTTKYQTTKCVATGYHLHWIMGFQCTSLERALLVIYFIPVYIFLWVFSWISLTVKAFHPMYLWLQYNLYFMHFRTFKAIKDSIAEVYIGPPNPQMFGDFHAPLGASTCLVWRMIIPYTGEGSF